MEPALERLRDAYRGDADVPGRDDTVARLFEQYIEAEQPAPSSRTRSGARQRFVDAVRRRMLRARR